MPRIFKYELVPGPNVHSIQSAALFRHVGTDPAGNLCVWAEVQEHRNKVNRCFAVVGTGNPIPQGYAFVGTAVTKPFVWHVFVAPEWHTEQAPAAGETLALPGKD